MADDREDTKGLAPAAPSDRTIMRTLAERVADSPRQIQPGQLVMLDQRGVAHGRKKFQRTVALYRLGIYGSLIGGCLLMLTGAFVPGVLVYAAGALPAFFGAYRGTGRLLAIEMIARQGNLDEAQRRFALAGRYKRRNPGMYGWLAGNLASHRGEHAAALEAWRGAMPRLDRLVRTMVRLSITRSLAIQGKHVEAERELDGIELPDGADDVIVGLVLTHLVMAAANPNAKVTDDELHDWSRRVLEYSHTGVELACLGMLFERQGDAEMLELAVTEARDRMHYPHVATWWPALQAWLDKH